MLPGFTETREGYIVLFRWGWLIEGVASGSRFRAERGWAEEPDAKSQDALDSTVRPRSGTEHTNSKLSM